MQEEMAGNKEEKEGQVQMRNGYSYTWTFVWDYLGRFYSWLPWIP